MSLTKTRNELASLALEFALLRQSKKKKWYPIHLWKKACTIAQKLSPAEVCRTIKVHPAYFQKKMAVFLPAFGEPHTFVELLPQKRELNQIAIRVESPFGYRLSIDGLSPSSLNVVLAEFLKGETPCCK